MHWQPYINGILLANEADISEQIEPLLNNREHLDEIIEDIMLGIGMESDPLISIDAKWSKEEPSIVICLRFQPVHGHDPEPVGLIEQTSVDKQIARVAAGGLMYGLEDKLFMSPGTGFLQINQENPPSIEEAGEVVRRLFSITDAAERLDEFGLWQRGSFLHSCEVAFGEEFSVTQFVDMSEKNYNTTITCLNTYRSFREKRYANLTFTHHREANYAKFPQFKDDQAGRERLMHKLMEISNAMILTCVEQRKLFSYAKNFGEDAIDRIATRMAEGHFQIKADLIDAITVNDGQKNYIFKFEGAEYRFRGVRSALPAGAEHIICIDDWTTIDAGGSVTPLPEWQRVGEAL